MDMSFLQDTPAINLLIWCVFGTGGIFSLIKYLIERRDFTNKKKVAKKQLDAMGHVGKAVSEFRDHGFSHAIVFKGHNHGGLPQVGREYFISVIQASVPCLANYKRKGAYSCFDIQEFSVALDDIEILKSIVEEIEVFVSFEDRDESKRINELKSVLYSYFNSHGLKNAYFKFLGFSENDILFLALAKSDEETTAKDISEVEFSIKKLKKELKTAGYQIEMKK